MEFIWKRPLANLEGIGGWEAQDKIYKEASLALTASPASLSPTLLSQYKYDV